MYIKEFTLKQHTPIIHFQANDAGATLRASEVKPKLDRFILKKLGGYEKLKKEHPSWFVSKEHKALDYKLRFTCNNNVEKYLVLSRYLNNKIRNEIISSHEDIDNILTETGYFGDEQFLKISKNSNNNKFYDKTKSSLHNAKRAIFIKSSRIDTPALIKGKILTKDEKLLETIINFLSEFFLVHNFGMRQTKGFGSYSIYTIDNEIINIDKNIFLKNDAKYYIKSKSINDSLRKIQHTHQLLKSGINNRNDYEKSELFYFFANKYIRWDKRFIKKYINGNKIDGRKLFYSKEPTDFYLTKDNIHTDNKLNKGKYKFIRALLGLAEQYEFLIDYSGRVDRKDKYIAKVQHVPDNDNPEKIERFTSPILYKVIDNDIYIIPQEMPDYLFNAKFRFDITLKSSDSIKSTNTIPVPSELDFKLIDFLDDAFENRIFKTRKI